MNKPEIAALSCRLLALYALLRALDALPAAFLALQNRGGMELFGTEPPPLWLLLLPLVLHLVAAAFLWRGADFLARRMVKTAHSASPAVVFDSKALPTAFSVVGALTLVQSLPHLAQMLMNLWFLSRRDPLLQGDFRGLTFPDFAGVAAQIALGLWLLLGSEGLATLLENARNAGRDRT